MQKPYKIEGRWSPHCCRIPRGRAREWWQVWTSYETSRKRTAGLKRLRERNPFMEFRKMKVAAP